MTVKQSILNFWNHFKNGVVSLYQDFIAAYKTAEEALLDFEKLGISKKNVYWAMFFGIISGLLEVLEFGLLYKLITALIQHNPDSILHGPSGYWVRLILPNILEGTVWMWAYLITFTVFVKASSVFAAVRSERFMFEAQRLILTQLNNEIFSRTIRTSFSYFDLYSLRGHTNYGDVSNLINHKTEKYSESLKYAFSLYMALFNLALFAITLGFLNWGLLIITLFVNPFSRWSSFRLSRIVANASRKDKQDRVSNNQYASGVIGSIFLVKTSNTEEQEIANFRVANEANLEEMQETSKLQLLEKPVNEISKTLSMTIVGVMTPFFEFLSGHGKLPSTFIGIVLMRQIDNQIDQIKFAIRTLASYQRQKKEIEAITGNELLEHNLIQGTELVRGLNDSMELKNLNFGYLPGRLVLKNINLSLKKGSVTALVGPNGSGKSSIAKVLLRLYNVPEKTYFIDGKDVDQLATASVRDLFSVVSQESVWLNKSIRENLSYGLHRVVSQEEMEEVCKRVNILDTIRKFPKGFDTKLTRGNVALSGGQQQCLSIARAIIRGSPVLILDEPTSAMDSITESLIQAKIEEVMEGKTVIVIAHRLSTIARATQVVFLNDGVIEEMGTIEELVNKGGGFYKMWNTQGEFWRKTLGIKRAA